MLEQRVAELAVTYPDEVPRPPHWGGYRLRADAMEFWQGRQSRLHDRLRYVRQPGGPGQDAVWRPERPPSGRQILMHF